MNNHNYGTLRPGQIRTLEVEVSSTGELHGALKEEDLHMAHFVAVSYVWGSEVIKKPLFVDGNVQPITTNADNILRKFCELQHRETELTSGSGKARVWIDAICINQRDEKEKVVQISMMQDIYAAAEHTLIRLGEPSDPAAAAMVFSWLHNLVGCGTLEEYLQLDNATKLARFWSSERWNDFCDLVMQPWHRRRWVIQEAVMSKDPWILYGDQTMQWTTFAQALERAAYLFSTRVQLPGFKNDHSVRHCDIGPILAMTGARIRRANPTALLHLLHQFRRNDSTEPRDRIIALLGMCGETERMQNLLTARENLEKVLINFAITHIRVHGNLDILCMATEAAREERKDHSYWKNGLEILAHRPDFPRSVYLESLPSWVPNATSPHACWTFGSEQTAYRETPKPYFRASLDAPPSIQDLGKV